MPPSLLLHSIPKAHALNRIDLFYEGKNWVQRGTTMCPYASLTEGESLVTTLLSHSSSICPHSDPPSHPPFIPPSHPPFVPPFHPPFDPPSHPPFVPPSLPPSFPSFASPCPLSSVSFSYLPFFSSFLPQPSHGILGFLTSARLWALNRLNIK